MEKMNVYKICRSDIKNSSFTTVKAHSMNEALMKFMQLLNGNLTKGYKITITKMA